MAFDVAYVSLLFQCNEINQAACDIANAVAEERHTITAGGIAMTDVYQETRNKEKTVAELRKGLQILLENDIDLIICEVRPFYTTRRLLV